MATDRPAKTDINSRQLHPDIKQILENLKKSPKAKQKKVSPKSRRTAELYKSSHNIGNRTAAERVGSYKESEVAVVYPEGFWDDVTKDDQDEYADISDVDESERQSDMGRAKHTKGDASVKELKVVLEKKQSPSKKETKKDTTKDRGRDTSRETPKERKGSKDRERNTSKEKVKLPKEGKNAGKKKADNKAETKKAEAKSNKKESKAAPRTASPAKSKTASPKAPKATPKVKAKEPDKKTNNDAKKTAESKKKCKAKDDVNLDEQKESRETVDKSSETKTKGKAKKNKVDKSKEVQEKDKVYKSPKQKKSQSKVSTKATKKTEKGKKSPGKKDKEETEEIIKGKPEKTEVKKSPKSANKKENKSDKAKNTKDSKANKEKTEKVKKGDTKKKVSKKKAVKEETRVKRERSVSPASSTSSEDSYVDMPSAYGILGKRAASRSRPAVIKPRAPRIRRTACLNANAIVSLLYENDEPSPKRSKVDSDESNASTLDSRDNSMSKSPTKQRKDSPAKKQVKNEGDNKDKKGSPAKEKGKKQKGSKKPDKKATGNKVKKKDKQESSDDDTESESEDEETRKRKAEEDVPLWPPPKRMASLNAQAILAASKEVYRRVKVEKASKGESVDESKSGKKTETDESKPSSANNTTKKTASKDTNNEADKKKAEVVPVKAVQQSSKAVSPEVQIVMEQRTHLPMPTPSPDVQIIEVRSPPHAPPMTQRVPPYFPGNNGRVSTSSIQPQPGPLHPQPYPLPTSNMGHYQQPGRSHYSYTGQAMQGSSYQSPPAHHIQGQRYDPMPPPATNHYQFSSQGGPQFQRPAYSGPAAAPMESPRPSQHLGAAPTAHSKAFSTDGASPYPSLPQQSYGQQQQQQPIRLQSSATSPFQPTQPSGLGHKRPVESPTSSSLAGSPFMAPSSASSSSSAASSQLMQPGYSQQPEQTEHGFAHRSSPMGNTCTYPYPHSNGMVQQPPLDQYQGMPPFSAMNAMSSYQMMACHRPYGSAFSMPAFPPHLGYLSGGEEMLPAGQDMCCMQSPFSYHVHQQQVKVLVHNPGGAFHTHHHHHHHHHPLDKDGLKDMKLGAGGPTAPIHPPTRPELPHPGYYQEQDRGELYTSGRVKGKGHSTGNQHGMSQQQGRGRQQGRDQSSQRSSERSRSRGSKRQQDSEQNRQTAISIEDPNQEEQTTLLDLDAYTAERFRVPKSEKASPNNNINKSPKITDIQADRFVRNRSENSNVKNEKQFSRNATHKVSTVESANPKRTRNITIEGKASEKMPSAKTDRPPSVKLDRPPSVKTDPQRVCTDRSPSVKSDRSSSVKSDRSSSVKSDRSSSVKSDRPPSVKPDKPASRPPSVKSEKGPSSRPPSAKLEKMNGTKLAEKTPSKNCKSDENSNLVNKSDSEKTNGNDTRKEKISQPLVKAKQDNGKIKTIPKTPKSDQGKLLNNKIEKPPKADTKTNEKQTKTDTKLPEKINKNDTKSTEKQCKSDNKMAEKLNKSETKLTEKPCKNETKMTEKLNKSETKPSVKSDKAPSGKDTKTGKSDKLAGKQEVASTDAALKDKSMRLEVRISKVDQVGAEVREKTSPRHKDKAEKVSPKQRPPETKKEAVKKRPIPPCKWHWKGEPRNKKVFNPTVEGQVTERLCYPAIEHADGDIIKERDCVLVCSGPKKTDIPYVAKIAALWEREDSPGDMMMSVVWYYRPEHTEMEPERVPKHVPCEIFASKHKDETPVACIEDKCHVLTFSEFCRFKALIQQRLEGVPSASTVVPQLSEDEVPRRGRLPPVNASPDTIFLCRKVYDFKLKRVLKNPTPS